MNSPEAQAVRHALEYYAAAFGALALTPEVIERAAQAATPAPADDLSSLRNRLRVAEESLDRCRAVCNATAEQWRADMAATPAAPTKEQA